MRGYGKINKIPHYKNIKKISISSPHHNIKILNDYYLHLLNEKKIKIFIYGIYKN